MDGCERKLKENKKQGVIDYRLSKKLLDKLDWKHGHVVIQCEHPSEEPNDNIILLVNETKAKRLPAEQARSLAHTLWPQYHETGLKWSRLKKNYFKFKEDEVKSEQVYNEKFEKAHARVVVARDGKKPAYTERGRILEMSPAQQRANAKDERLPYHLLIEKLVGKPETQPVKGNKTAQLRERIKKYEFLRKCTDVKIKRYKAELEKIKEIIKA